MASPQTILLAIGIAALTAHVPACADSYPDRPIRFIVPFPPGGNTDVLARILAKGLTEAWQQQVVIDNRPGAGGTIGVALTAKASPDGYTIVMGSFGSVLLAKSLYKNLPYDSMRDLDPVVLVTEPPGVMVCSPTFKARTPRELIELARTAPAQFNYASAGNGAWNHLFGELFKEQAKVKMAHVPYKGTVPALNDIMGGRVEWMFSPFPPAMPQIRGNRLRALGVTSLKRSDVLPEVPTISEAGLPGYEAESWFAVLAPRNSPRDAIKKMNQQLNRIMQSAEVQGLLAADGARAIGGTPEQLAASMKAGIQKWKKVVDALDLQPE
ncbi:MAG: tripartite tricarboxylate transporter substrate binding protein [Betaproteobacteria bacterium]|nr:tripartite tricarboxylate transporter substrate binding protein [Betaproteobacteria bacterium]